MILLLIDTSIFHEIQFNLEHRLIQAIAEGVTAGRYRVLLPKLQELELRSSIAELVKKRLEEASRGLGDTQRALKGLARMREDAKDALDKIDKLLSIYSASSDTEIARRVDSVLTRLKEGLRPEIIVSEEVILLMLAKERYSRFANMKEDQGKAGNFGYKDAFLVYTANTYAATLSESLFIVTKDTGMQAIAESLSIDRVFNEIGTLLDYDSKVQLDQPALVQAISEYFFSEASDICELLSSVDWKDHAKPDFEGEIENVELTQAIQMLDVSLYDVHADSISIMLRVELEFECQILVDTYHLSWSFRHQEDEPRWVGCIISQCQEVELLIKFNKSDKPFIEIDDDDFELLSVESYIHVDVDERDLKRFY